MDEQNTNNGQQEQNEQTQQGQQESGGIDYDKLASILEGKQKVTEETVIKSYMKQQGLSQDEMAEAIKNFKAKREAEKPDVDGMRKQIADLQAQIAQDNLDRVATEEALKLGLDSKNMPYVKKMADLTKVFKSDGTVDTELVQKALSQVLTDVPALKPTAKENKGFQIGGNGNPDAQTNGKLDEELKNIFTGKNTTQSII